jgi:hypothetical protein
MQTSLLFSLFLLLLFVRVALKLRSLWFPSHHLCRLAVFFIASIASVVSPCPSLCVGRCRLAVFFIASIASVVSPCPSLCVVGWGFICCSSSQIRSLGGGLGSSNQIPVPESGERGGIEGWILTPRFRELEIHKTETHLGICPRYSQNYNPIIQGSDSAQGCHPRLRLCSRLCV